MKSDEVHWPGAYDHVLRSSGVPFWGATFLAAAVYLRKMYCTTISTHKGGTAIAIGLMFDVWTGQGRPDAVRNARLRLE